MMDRRRFLVSGSLTVVGLKLGLLAGCRPQLDPLSVPPMDAAAGTALTEIAGGVEGIGYIGPHCRERLAGPDPAQALLARLRQTGEPTLGEALARSLQADFAAGRTREIADWRLSETECLLAALAARLQGLTAPRLAEDGELATGEIVEVENWGPRETPMGEVFNEQPHGGGALWIRIADDAPASTRIVFDGEELQTYVGAGLITASLSAEQTEALVRVPGSREVALVDTARAIVQPLGSFTVLETGPGDD